METVVLCYTTQLNSTAEDVLKYDQLEKSSLVCM